MTARVKRESLPRRLFWLGSATLLAFTHGSHTETPPYNNSLRRERRRNTGAVTALDEHIHHAGTMHFQEFAGAIAENKNVDDTANTSNAMSTATTVTSTSNNRKRANTNTKMRLGPTSNSAPTPERSIIRKSFRYPTNTNANIVDSQEFMPAPPDTARTSSSDRINSFPPTGYPFTQEGLLENSRDEFLDTVDRSIITDDTQDISFIDLNDDKDTSVILTYQNSAGICGDPGPGVGCANEQPNAENPKGNPNDIVNCYDVTEFGVEIPFGFDSIRFWIGDSTAVPPDLQLKIWVRTPGGGPISSRLLYSQPLLGHTLGENIFDIDYGALVRQSNICIGVTSTSVDAGLRIQTDPGGVGEASYIRSPACSVDDFTSLFDAGLKNNFCIEALVSFGDALR